MVQVLISFYSTTLFAHSIPTICCFCQPLNLPAHPVSRPRPLVIPSTAFSFSSTWPSPTHPAEKAHLRHHTPLIIPLQLLPFLLPDFICLQNIYCHLMQYMLIYHLLPLLTMEAASRVGTVLYSLLNPPCLEQWHICKYLSNNERTNERMNESMNPWATAFIKSFIGCWVSSKEYRDIVISTLKLLTALIFFLWKDFLHKCLPHSCSCHDFECWKVSFTM